MKRTLAERLWSRVNVGGPDDCWDWTGATNNKGYGHIKGVGRKNILVHRLAYQLTHGPISDSIKVCHSCDHPLCCNPRHHFLGTQGDNLRDCASKGRMKNCAQTHPERLCRGSNCPWAKLNEWQVVQAMARYLMGDSQSEIAADIGVCRRTVGSIVSGTRWSHLFAEEGA